MRKISGASHHPPRFDVCIYAIVALGDNLHSPRRSADAEGGFCGAKVMTSFFSA